uniref:Uncharacterized protein n=1 Tax=Peronospora matthiolae TaxID=2874970 RepID=A0AAV1ULY6_9STRA
MEKHPDRIKSYAEFISMDILSIKLMADSPKDDCAFRAFQMDNSLEAWTSRPRS